jgi:preprotein translocase subunit YajC
MKGKRWLVLALVIILLLVLGTFLLIRNMNKRLKRLPESFDNQPGAKDESEQSEDEQHRAV